MAIFESVSRLTGTFIEILQTRLELLAVEVEEESVRIFSYFFFAAGAIFCLGISLLLAVVLIVVLSGESHRVAALVALMVIFALAGGGIILALGNRYRLKPRMFDQTLTELSRDIERLKPDNKQ